MWLTVEVLRSFSRTFMICMNTENIWHYQKHRGESVEAPISEQSENSDFGFIPTRERSAWSQLTSIIPDLSRASLLSNSWSMGSLQIQTMEYLMILDLWATCATDPHRSCTINQSKSQILDIYGDEPAITWNAAQRAADIYCWVARQDMYCLSDRGLTVQIM